MDRHEISNYEYDFVLNTLCALDCSRSLAIAILYRHNEFSQIVNIEFNPEHYNNFTDARDSLLATEFLRKHADLPTNLDLDKPCFEALLKSEESCRIVNDKFMGASLITHYDTFLRARRKIENILGSFDPQEFLDCSCWGPGSTLRIKRREATFAHKFRLESEVTLASYNFVKTWISSQFPHWGQNFRIYEGNKIITVPKNAKTNRLIAVEPSLNLFFQKGIGSMIRKRLKRHNVDLDDQTNNQLLSQEASLSDCLATIDFSAASDSIAYGLVEFLLPRDWFLVLDKLRCERGQVGDSFIQFEKFSSMGNGFTFELESLIFFAITQSVVPYSDPLYSKITVYGDDLIAPSKYMEILLDVFSESGFKINQKKTFFNGYYRESCGFHFWNGERICPFYLRSSLKSLNSCMKIHNQMTRSYAVHFGCEYTNQVFLKVIHDVRNKCYRGKVPYVPPHFGDCGIIVPWDVARPSVSEFGYGWKINILTPKTFKKSEDDEAYFLEKLLNMHRTFDAPHKYNDLPGGNVRILTNRDQFRLTASWSSDWPCLSSYFSMR